MLREDWMTTKELKQVRGVSSKWHLYKELKLNKQVKLVLLMLIRVYLVPQVYHLKRGHKINKFLLNLELQEICKRLRKEMKINTQKFKLKKIMTQDNMKINFKVSMMDHQLEMLCKVSHNQIHLFNNNHVDNHLLVIMMVDQTQDLLQTKIKWMFTLRNTDQTVIILQMISMSQMRRLMAINKAQSFLHTKKVVLRSLNSLH